MFYRFLFFIRRFRLHLRKTEQVINSMFHFLLLYKTKAKKVRYYG